MYYKVKYEVLTDAENAMTVIEYASAESIEKCKNALNQKHLIKAPINVEVLESMNGYFLKNIEICEIPKEQVEIQITLEYGDSIKNENELAKLVREKINQAIINLEV